MSKIPKTVFVLAFLYSVLLIFSFIEQGILGLPYELIFLFVWGLVIYGLVKGYRLALLIFRLQNHIFFLILFFGYISFVYPSDITYFSASLAFSYDDIGVNLTGITAMYVVSFLFLLHTYALYNKSIRLFCDKEILKKEDVGLLESAKSCILKHRALITFYLIFCFCLPAVFYAFKQSAKVLLNEAYITSFLANASIVDAHYANNEKKIDEYANLMIESQNEISGFIDSNAYSEESKKAAKDIQVMLDSIKSRMRAKERL